MKSEDCKLEIGGSLALRCEEAAEVVMRGRAAALPAGALEKNVLMYAPAGTHTITPGVGEGSCEATILVEPKTAEVLNASLARVNAAIAPQRCFIDKEHEGKDATAWPESFFYAEQSPDGKRAPGIYCRVEFSKLGRELIDGKVMRAFSPSILTDADLPKKIRAGQHVTIADGKRGSPQNPARIVGVAVPDIGTLTNRPAFHEILPLFAKESRQTEKASAGTQTQKTKLEAMVFQASSSGPDRVIQKMKTLTAEELNELRARKAELEQEIPKLKAKDLSVYEDAQAAQLAEAQYNAVCLKLEAHEALEQAAVMKAEVTKQRKQAAQVAIKAAQRDGRLPSRGEQAEKMATQWEQDLVEDPDKFMPRLDALVKPAALRATETPMRSDRLIINPSRAQEIRASSVHVLKKMAELAASNQTEDVATLYASEIRKRYEEGDSMPFRELRAADVTDANLGTLAGTLVTQRTLEFFRLHFDGLLQRISTDFSEQPAQFKQTTQTRVVVAPALVTYDPTLDAAGLPKGYVQTTQAQTLDVPITLDKHTAVPVSIGVELLATTVRRLFDEQASPAAYVLLKDLIDNLYSKITPGNFNAYANNLELPAGGRAAGVIQTDETSFDKRTIGIAGRVFNPAGVPLTDRFVLLNTDYHDDLENDPTIIRLATYQAGQTNVITDGLLPMIKRFQPIEAPNLPATNNLIGFAGHKCSLAVQSRVPNDYTAMMPAGATHGLVQTVTDPESRLTAMIVWFADHLRATGNFRIAWMYGTAVGNKNGGICLTHA